MRCRAMKTTILILLAALIPAQAQISSPAANMPASKAVPGKAFRISLGTFSTLERDFDGAYATMADANNPPQMLGATRGVYLDGYGVVITTEMSLVRTPGISPFKPTIPKEEADRIHKQKLERLPALRQKMKDLMKTAALRLADVPGNQQIVVAVRLDYAKWEDTTGLPGQILMRADRSSAALGQITAVEEQ